MFNGFRRADDNWMPPVTKICLAANGRLLRRKPGHRFPFSAIPLAYRPACRLYQRNAAGDVPNIRTLESSNAQHAGCDKRTLYRGRTRLARFPVFVLNSRSRRNAGKTPPYGRVQLWRNVTVFKTKLATRACVIDAGPQRVAG